MLCQQLRNSTYSLLSPLCTFNVEVGSPCCSQRATASVSSLSRADVSIPPSGFDMFQSAVWSTRPHRHGCHFVGSCSGILEQLLSVAYVTYNVSSIQPCSALRILNINDRSKHFVFVVATSSPSCKTKTKTNIMHFLLLLVCVQSFQDRA